MRAGSVFFRAARMGIQRFRSELQSVKEQTTIHTPEVASEAQPQIVNLKNQQNIAQVLDAVAQKGSPVTINIIDAKYNKGSIGSTFVKASSTTSTKKTEQKFDRSFNQETKQNPISAKYHEGHLIGVSAATLAIVEFVHYMAK